MTEQTNQSDVDRLVEQLETDILWHERRGNETIANYCRQAANELRRLYAENESLREQYTAIDITCENLEAANAELLEALKLAINQNDLDMLMTSDELRQARAVIAKYGETK